jgi:hypothetical protein
MWTGFICLRTLSTDHGHKDGQCHQLNECLFFKQSSTPWSHLVAECMSFRALSPTKTPQVFNCTNMNRGFHVKKNLYQISHTVSALLLNFVSCCSGFWIIKWQAVQNMRRKIVSHTDAKQEKAGQREISHHVSCCERTEQMLHFRVVIFIRSIRWTTAVSNAGLQSDKIKASAYPAGRRVTGTSPALSPLL